MAKQKIKKAVLAYSGGLDTSVILKWLQDEYQCEVVTFTADIGQEDDFSHVRGKAEKFGIKEIYIDDLKEEFVKDFVFPMFRANTVYEGKYLLGTSIARPLIAKRQIEIAQATGADAVSHGATGKGNDQVRFDMIFQIMIPQLEIITPIRDMNLSRESEIQYLKSKGVEMNFAKAVYSINKGLWGTSVGGRETLKSRETLPEEAWPTQVTKTGSEEIKLTFQEGELVRVNDQKFNHPTEAIQFLQNIAAPYGVGRDVHIGDTIIGIKGRVGFEAAAPMVIIKAHHALEKHVLSKWQLQWKDQIAQFYGTWLHEGQILDPVMRDMEAYLESSQRSVTGNVYVLLNPYRFSVVGIESQFDLMNSAFGSYGEVNASFTGEDVKGFTRIFGNQTVIYHMIRESLSNGRH